MSRIGVMSWNVNFRSADTVRLLEALADQLDIVTLQEVTRGHHASFEEQLSALGLSHLLFTGGDSRYGNLIASRHPLSAIPEAVRPWPELAGHTLVSAPGGDVHVLTVHAPNGSGNGWAKIETLAGVRDVVSALGGARVILTGDFNEPQLCRLVDGKVITWGQEASGDSFRTWDRWRSDDPADTGDRWDEVVRWFFEQDRSALRHAYWDAHGFDVLPETHISGGVPRSFDHVFVSGALEVVECRYLKDTRPEFSDHTAVLASLRVVPA